LYASFWLCFFFNTHAYAYFIIIWIFNGFFQSSGWPATVAIMGNWFKKTRGMVYGIWSANTPVGNIFGTLLATWCLATGWYLSMIAPGVFILVTGIICAIFLYASPERAKVSEDEASTALLKETSEKPEASKGVSFLQALRIPGVIAYAISYAFLKFVNYSLFFWLPYFLQNVLKYDENFANTMSTLYDVGGVIGGFAGGLISDYLRNSRALVAVPMLWISVLTLLLYNLYGGVNAVLNGFIMILIGIFLNGQASIMSSAVAADLGSHPSLKGNARALATVTGIIDGTGSIGAAFEGVVVAYVAKTAGWDAVFYLLMAVTGLSGAVLLPLFFKELKAYREARKVSAAMNTFKVNNSIDA